MTPLELKRCRMIHKSLTLRLNMLKAKLRTDIIKNDCLCLDLSSGRCLADGDDVVPQHIVGERITAKLLKSDTDKLRLFDAVGKMHVNQLFEEWIGDAMPIELVPFFDELGAALVGVAKDAVRQHLTPTAAWKIMASEFDAAATRDAITEFALAIGKSGLAGDEVEHEGVVS